MRVINVATNPGFWVPEWAAAWLDHENEQFLAYPRLSQNPPF